MHDKPLGGSGAVKNNYGAGAVRADQRPQPSGI